jgi:spore coat polysaccharide biosynthesis protein SpsF
VRRVVAVIQARAGSTRLPRKVLRPLGDRPVLAWVIGAARDSGVCDEVVVATTTDPRDDEVAALAATYGATVVRGPEAEVLTRYLLAADATHAETVIRITSDCPLLDPILVAMCVEVFGIEAVDYVTTEHEYSLAHGMDVEVFDASLLRRLDAVATGAERTHVTSYVLTHPDEFTITAVSVDPPSTDLRITLDEPADARVLDELVAALGTNARDYDTVVAYLRAHPELAAINADVAVKPLAAG